MVARYDAPRHETVRRFVKDSSSIIDTYPPRLVVGGGFSSATARIGTPAVAIPESGSAANIESGSTTTSTAATQGAGSLTLSASLDMHAGHVLLITPTNGGQFTVTVGRTATGTTLYLKEPLPVALPSGSTVSQFRIYASITTSHTASVGTGIVEWSASFPVPSASGTETTETLTWTEQFRIVERWSDYTLTADLLTMMSPYAARLKPDADADYSETIDAAWRRYVEPSLLMKAIKPEHIINGPHFEALHVAAVERHLSDTYDEDPTVRAEKKVNLVEALGAVLNATDIWLSDDTGSIDTPAPNDGGRLTATMVLR